MPSPYDLGHDDGTIAGRERIVALIREKAEEWAAEAKDLRKDGLGMIAYEAGSQAVTARELATLIGEATDG